MATPTVVPIADGAAIVTTETDSDGIEVTQEWLESLFAAINSTLRDQASILIALSQGQLEVSQQLSSLRNQLPENLTAMIQIQQETITSLIAEQMVTVRALLTPPAPVVIPETPPSVEVVHVAPETVPQSEPRQPKHRRI